MTSIVYFDTSALTKLVIPELGSDVVTRYWNDQNIAILSSELVLTELQRAVRRQEPAEISTALEILSGIQTISVTREILNYAGGLEPAAVRSLDAIHLASAIALGDSLNGLLTFDTRMTEAAKALKLPVLDTY
jgi:uncharacterized protein